jgi:hypothetical protein
MRQRLSTTIVFFSLALMPFGITGCGDSGGKGAICTPDKSVERSDCIIDDPVLYDEKSNQVVVDSESDVRKICSSSCTKVEYLAIRQVPDLETLGAFEKIDTVLKGVSIQGNRKLRSLDGLNVRDTNFGISVRGNWKLGDITALSNQTKLSSFVATANNSLASLKGLHNLKKIGERVEPQDANRGPGLVLKHNAIRSLTPLSGVELETNNRLIIRDEDNLDTLEGLAGLSEPITILEFWNNNNLNTVEALDGVPELHSALFIGNRALPTCKAQRFVEERTDNPNLVKIRSNDSDASVCQ